MLILHLRFWHIYDRQVPPFKCRTSDMFATAQSGLGPVSSQGFYHFGFDGSMVIDCEIYSSSSCSLSIIYSVPASYFFLKIFSLFFVSGDRWNSVTRKH